MALFNIWIFQENPNRLKAPQAASGLYPVKVNISSDLDRTKEGNRKRKMINTGVACSPEVFKAMYPALGETVTSKMKKIAATAEAIEMKKTIEEVKNRYYNIVKDLTIENNPNSIFTIKQLLAAVSSSHGQKVSFEKAVTLLSYYFRKYIADNKEFLTKNSIVRMNSALTSFEIFGLLPDKYTPETALKVAKQYRLEKQRDEGALTDLTIYDIDKSFLTKWQKYMRNGKNFENGKPRTLKTINGYVKNLISVLKEVVNNNFIGYTEAMFPIGSDRKKQYQNPSPKKNEAKIPKYLNEEDLQKLKDYKTEIPQEEKAKDIWLLSYYLGGCNMVDLVEFKEQDIEEEGQQLSWYRMKNQFKRSQTVSIVSLNDEVKKLIEKYKGKNYLLNFHENSENKENTADNLRRFVNKTYLKRIAKKTNMKQSLNFQMARHTCFSNLLRNGATFSEIMEVSGHSRTETLKNYLTNLRPADMKKLMKKL